MENNIGVVFNSFQIEDLKVAENLLTEVSFDQIAESLSFNLRTHSRIDKKLVPFSTHAFLQSMQIAYYEHRPFVLSPDMIWLLISQGFAHHVNFNAEKLRNSFVDFQEKKNLTIKTDNLLGNSHDWVNIPQQLIEQMSPYLPDKLIETLTANFSTTGITEQIASQITILYGFKSYFEYVVHDIICGIPSITIEGTAEDWQKIIDKAKSLRIYHLEDWIDSLLPLIKEFIDASQGIVNPVFWRSMFKIPTQGYCNFPSEFDGWIFNFFPYYADGVPVNLAKNKINSIADFPDEICSVPFCWILDYGTEKTILYMEFMAGFVGVSQNYETKALRPEIGWMVGEAKESPKINLSMLRADVSISLNLINEIPEELHQAKELDYLSLTFINKVKIPRKLMKIKLHGLTINGDISVEEKEKVVKMFPFSHLYFNREKIKYFYLDDYYHAKKYLSAFTYIPKRLLWRLRCQFWWL